MLVISFNVLKEALPPFFIFHFQQKEFIFAFQID